ncbi:hypothetical protein LTR46_004933 [Exophiala xenobiotica]|nr:hypothetical protein LTR18_004328 [Exophiala xenobiotica]KAK5557122.1 hypothetical protein LTR46_004933 [Exophiala xenobiotica]
MAKDILVQFNEVCPGNALAPAHFSILSGLFREAVNAMGQRLDLNDGASDLDSTSSRPAADAVEPDALLSQKTFLNAVSETIVPDHSSQRSGHHYKIGSPLPFNIMEYHGDSTLLSALAATLPPFQEAESLTNVFFTYLESNWYYFDESWFRGLLAQVYQEISPAQQLECTTICLVFLVLALGESFKHVNQSTPVDSREGDQALVDVPGGRFYQVAIGLMPSVLAATTVESVQCCLLTALYVLPIQNTSLHYTYLGLALRLATGLSLHLNGTDDRITPENREVRTRVFWTAYCLERRSSVVMGLPTMLQMRSINVPLPQRMPNLDKLHPQQVDRLIAFTKLTLVMNKVTEASPVDEAPDKFSWACSALEKWKQSLPAHLVALDTASLRANAHLDIMYQMIWIYIGRGALLRLVRKRLHQNGGGKSSDLIMDSATRKLAERCTNAAYTIIEWIDLLSIHNRLAKFSYTDFHSCSSAVIVLLLSEIFHAQNLYSSSIDRGVDALHFMASGGQLAKDALHLVERLRASIRKSNGHNAEGQDGSTSEVRPSNAAEVPSDPAQDTTAEYTASDFAKFDPALFSDLEPSLLQYSSQDLSLFGFDGFYPTVEADGSLWIQP